MPARYPRHAKAFARPIKLDRAGRRQLRQGFAVRRYAGSFKSKGLEGIELAKAIVKDVASFEEMQVSHERAQRLWARRSANSIIRAKKVVRAKFINGDLGKHTNVIQGCTDKTLAAVAALRAAGFKVLIVREMLHTQGKMIYNVGKRWKVFIVDPDAEAGQRFRAMSAEEKRREAGFIRHGMYAEGASLAEIGITSYKNFFRYAPKHIREG
ncbi:MAG: hypothetical protein JW744_00025 [Candidatus Diapherotrites archaeon]|uniref:Uncharacterized protein n=1 Tax=Candidatus Iainarchaeum sp. TaxID=3101447 RepID=A0A938YWX4_9ARCH|nr:hypothetical protein [Candidatus Diapherotrites archaeon]